jgi:hypothetical protein
MITGIRLIPLWGQVGLIVPTLPQVYCATTGNWHNRLARSGGTMRIQKPDNKSNK